MVETHLLLDGAQVRHHLSDGVELFVNPAKKDVAAGVMLREEFFDNPPRRYEPRIDNGYPTVLRDPATGILRLYYTEFVVDHSAADVPLDQRQHATYQPSHERVTALALAESRDGITWVKPSLGLVDFEGSTDNNLVLLGAHGTGVLIDTFESDPAKLYKLVTRMDTPTESYMAVAYSSDGIHFSNLHRWDGPSPRADSHNAPWQDPVTGAFYMTTRIWNDGTRICAISRSTDFEKWSECEEILRGRPPFDQIYSMPVFYKDGQHIGLASMYHEGDRSAPDFDLVDCELATAHEIESWQLVAPGQSLIARGAGSYPSGEFDSGCIYASVPIEIDGRWWVYYFGGNGRHTGYRETSLARAEIDIDRLSGYRAKKSVTSGRLVLGPYRLETDDLELFADVHGSLQWRIINTSGEEITSHQSCAQSSGWQRLDLSKALKSAHGELVYIDLSITDSDVYALRSSNPHERFR